MFIYIGAFKLWYNSISGGIKMNIGYARVSTGLQNLDLQKDSLEKYNCEKIYYANYHIWRIGYDSIIF